LNKLQVTIAAVVISLVLSATAAIFAFLKRKNLTLGFAIFSSIFSLICVAVYGSMYDQMKNEIPAYNDDPNFDLSLKLTSGFYLMLVAMFLQSVASLIDFSFTLSEWRLLPFPGRSQLQLQSPLLHPHIRNWDKLFFCLDQINVTFRWRIGAREKIVNELPTLCLNVLQNPK
jgi:hypothetical protein